MTMDTQYSASQRTQGHGFRSNRRSLLASAATGIAALSAWPVWAHNGKADSAKGRSFADLKQADAASRVETIHYLSGVYRVTTADGKCAEFAAANLRFAIDSSNLGPYSGRPVILSSGYGRDRALVFFSAPSEIANFIKAG
jgi:hypothetical protein